MFTDHHSLQLAGEVANFVIFLKYITGELTSFELEDQFNMTGWQDLLVLIHEWFSQMLLSLCCTRSARHGTLFPFLVLALILRLRADGRCHAVQARLCRKSCGHVIGLGLYLLSMTSSPFALVAVPGFSSFHFRFAPLISTPFAIRRR